MTGLLDKVEQWLLFQTKGPKPDYQNLRTAIHDVRGAVMDAKAQARVTDKATRRTLRTAEEAIRLLEGADPEDKR